MPEHILTYIFIAYACIAVVNVACCFSFDYVAPPNNNRIINGHQLKWRPINTRPASPSLKKIMQGDSL